MSDLRALVAPWLRRVPAWAEPVEAMLAAGAEDEVRDAFRQILPFGTGGRRGPMGPGPNRMNDWTVAQAAAGHASWLGRRDAPSIVIGYDVRHHSRRFAEVAARVYLAAGVRVWLQPASDPRYLATPELSLAVRWLGATAGLMVTASHNPPEDNGLKFYDHEGAQLVPPADGEVLAAVAEAEVPELAGTEWSVEPLDVSALRAHYLSLVPPLSRRLRVVFSPLHGCGAGTVDAALERAGAEVFRVASQMKPDPEFGTLPGRSANPENPAVFALALAHAVEVDAELVITCDPDADRVGAAIRGGDGYRVLNGNEIAALVVRATLARGTGQVIQTAVTSSLVSRMARDLGATVVDDLPVGFKWIAQALDPDTFVAGVEESHGLLLTAQIREKDAAGGAVALAQAVASEDPNAALDEMQARWGPVHTAQVAIRRPGARGRAEMDALLAELQATPPVEIEGQRVRASVRHGMQIWQLDTARIVVRPSGTEPKIKAYLEAGSPEALSRLSETVRRLLGASPAE